MSMSKIVTYVFLLSVCVLTLYSWFFPCQTGSKYKMVPKDSVQYVYDHDNHAFPYEKTMPLIFIGGVPRSGTTLMRAMLDAHPEVRCGEETRIIPRLLGMRSQWARSQRESTRLQEAGISDEVIDSALAAFILEVIAKHGEPAPRLCNKDPFTLKSSVYLSQMFPNAKFLLMVRDGRATVHSIISRKVTISGFDLKSYRNCLSKWNQVMESMYYQCLRLGSDRCMPVYYEQLVLHPKEWMEKILVFLDIPWHDSVLHHDEMINKPGGVSLSKVERSTDQVIKPVNLEALSKWVGAIPEDVKRDVRTLAPMLERLGYSPTSYPPNYGDADQFVILNTKHIKNHEDQWRKKGEEVISQSKPPKKVAAAKNNMAAVAAGGAPVPHGQVTYGKDGGVNKQEAYGKDFEDAKQVGEKEADKSEGHSIQKPAENQSS
jgi:protein-tyrosine sulfotransferase